jgi:diguanylate cyclase (GGDEF)-like protein
MPRRTHLRTRVLLLTAAFSLVLLATTFGLSWRAKVSQERWSRLISVETEAIATLESLIRGQNGFRAQLGASGGSGDYRVVEQLLDNPSLRSIDTRRLRARMRAFQGIASERGARRADIDATSNAVAGEAQSIVNARKREIARTLPQLERDTRAMMLSGLAVAWILIVLSFAGVQTMLRKVVRPLEKLSAAASQIAAGDLDSQVPIGGDVEIYRLGQAVSSMNRKLAEHARTDELTSLPNFRAFRERIEGEIERAARYPAVFGVMVLDLDHFKKYNDSFGHLAGNDALQRVAGAVRESVRTPDFAARYGGEEFAVILPEIDAAALAVVAERVRAAVEGLPVPVGGSSVSVSIGAAIYPIDGNTPELLFHAADERLYEAKKSGRNRVVGPAAASVATA